MPKALYTIPVSTPAPSPRSLSDARVMALSTAATQQERPSPSPAAKRSSPSPGDTISLLSKVPPPSLSLSPHHRLTHPKDDPYYYLYFGTLPRPASYFSLEASESEQGTGVDSRVGRVLRFDSFSKVLSAGMRIGFVTGPAALVGRIDQHVRFTLPKYKNSPKNPTPPLTQN